MKTTYFFLILFFVLQSCKPGRPIYSLESQYSPDSNYIIYKIFYVSTSTEENNLGYKIAKQGQEFNKDLPDLPVTFLSMWNNDSELRTIEIEDNQGGQETKPLETEFKVNGLRIVNQKFNALKLLSGQYRFDSVTQSKDSIFFHGIEKEYGDPEFDRTAFRKGSISIASKEGLINIIEIRSITQKEGESIYLIHDFIPKNRININSINSYGVFKQL